MCRQTDAAVRLSQHVELQHAVDERGPVVAPHELRLTETRATALDTTKFTAENELQFI